MLQLLACACVCACVLAGSGWPPSARASAEALVSRMTELQLLNLTSALQLAPYQGTIPAAPALGLPHIGNEDGPQGVCGGLTGVTAFPSAITVASTWDAAAARAFGAANGLEHRIKGANVMLGPGVNLARIPWCGRLFEYLGEDPVLAGTLAGAIVAGVQSNNISAVVKHFILNVQETARHNVSSVVDRRTFMELYTPAFAAAVDAGVGSVMCSCEYRCSRRSPRRPRAALPLTRCARSRPPPPPTIADNRINGSTWACESAAMQEELLRGRLGFQGFVRSDGHALWETAAPALNGCDQEMPNTQFFGPALGAAVANGSVPLARLREMVTRQLTAYYALNIIQDPAALTPGATATSPERVALARTLAAAGSVLLKNDQRALPLDARTLRSLAVFGDEYTSEGGGSGHVQGSLAVTPYDGIVRALNGGVLPPRPAGPCALLNDTDYDQPASQCVGAQSVSDCCAQCSALDGCNFFSFHAGAECPGAPPGAGSRCWLKPDNSGQRVLAGVVSGACPRRPSGAAKVTYGGSDPAAAPALAAAAEVAVVVVATQASEGSDRTSLNFDAPYDALVAAVAAANPRTIVVTRCPGPCLTPWAAAVPAIVQQGFAGQEAGNALADILFGAVNPAGRLPLSWPQAMTRTWLSPPGGGPVNAAQWPGTVRGADLFPTTDFSEQLFVGYRWFDATGEEPAWAFGHGLSFSTFSASGLAIAASTPAPNASATITCTVRHAAGPPGQEVVQLYIAYPPELGEPPQLLRAFHKTRLLAAGDSEEVSWSLDSRAFSVFDVVSDDWRVHAGTYTLRLGTSSRNIVQSLPLHL